jgi:glycosyltransferase involved in cell wall biosynthesis
MEVERLRASWNISKQHFAIGCVGNIQERKSQLTLIRSIPQILASVPQARFVVVGEPDSNEPKYIVHCKREADKLGVSNVVHWVGFENRIPLVMNALDLCVCVPIEESFGLTAAEALAAGTPVVATSVGGLPETVIDGETGILIRPQRPDELAEAIVRLAQDHSERARLGENGRNHVIQTFGLSAHLENLESIYRQVAA